MAEVVEIVNTDVETLDVVKKIYKTPEYIAKANKNYYEKKKNDPEYIKQKLELKEQRKLQKEQEKAMIGNIEKETVKNCPEYIRRAVRNYAERNKNNPEFIQKRKEAQKKYREENAERLREDAKKRYQLKKLDKQRAQAENPEMKEKTPAIETLVIE